MSEVLRQEVDASGGRAPEARHCAHHPDAPAGERCAECRIPFCESCLVELRGRRICGICKAAEVREMLRVELPRNNQAHDALLLALLGAVCIGPGLFLEAVALAQGIVALRVRVGRPAPDRWKAGLAIGIASATLAVYLYGLVALLYH
jgi:hypothetical protein